MTINHISLPIIMPFELLIIVNGDLCSIINNISIDVWFGQYL